MPRPWLPQCLKSCCLIPVMPISCTTAYSSQHSSGCLRHSSYTSLSLWPAMQEPDDSDVQTILHGLIRSPSSLMSPPQLLSARCAGRGWVGSKVQRSRVQGPRFLGLSKKPKPGALVMGGWLQPSLQQHDHRDSVGGQVGTGKEGAGL